MRGWCCIPAFPFFRLIAPVAAEPSVKHLIFYSHIELENTINISLQLKDPSQPGMRADLLAALLLAWARCAVLHMSLLQGGTAIRQRWLLVQHTSLVTGPAQSTPLEQWDKAGTEQQSSSIRTEHKQVLNPSLLSLPAGAWSSSNADRPLNISKSIL